MKIIVTIMKGFSKVFGEFQVKETKIKSKVRETTILPTIEKATGGPVPPIKVEE